METIIISILATIISLISLIFTAVSYLKQYVKRLYIDVSYDVACIRNNKNFPSMMISVVNTSAFPVYIKEIGIYAYNKEINDYEYVFLGCLEPDYDESFVKIIPQESRDFYFELIDVKCWIEENMKMGLAQKNIKIAVKDTTDKLYIRKGIKNIQFYSYLKEIKK